jgi:hypothetical protein
MTSPPRNSPHHSPEREDRVAAALRENLRKRKAQQQSRSSTPDSSTQNNENQNKEPHACP